MGLVEQWRRGTTTGSEPPQPSSWYNPRHHSSELQRAETALCVSLSPESNIKRLNTHITGVTEITWFVLRAFNEGLACPNHR